MLRDWLFAARHNPDETPMPLTDRLLHHAATLTPSERALADAFMRRYPESLLDSASVMATQAGTSASTVVRLFAKLGYASLDEARREARAELSARLQTAAQRAPATLGGERSLQQCVDDALLHDQHNLAATRDGLDMVVFQQVVDLLVQAPGRVFVLAEKNSAPVSAFLVAHLNLCRPGVQDLGLGAPALVDKLLWVQPEDVLLVFTVRRYSTGALHAARHFRQLGCPVVVLTDSPASPMLEHASQALLVQTANASPFDSYTSAFFLCNALVSAVAQQHRGTVRQALERRDALWQDFPSEAVVGPRKAPTPRR